MPEYLIHRNGRGRLFGDAEANRATYIDKTSSASGSAKLRDCELRVGSKAQGRCQVYGGKFTQSIIRGKTIVAGSPVVFGSVLDCSEVSGTPDIYLSRLLGTTEVCDDVSISWCVLKDATVYGKAQLMGEGGRGTKATVFTGRVHEGIWSRAPKHIKLPWCDLSECVNGKVLVDCYCRPAIWWLKFGPRTAAKWGWSQDMIDVTMDTISREFAAFDYRGAYRALAARKVAA